MASKHSHKEIRKALAEAEAAGFTVRQLHGHTWGHVDCVCGEHVKVFSTGKNPEIGAKRIRSFTRKHAQHAKGGRQWRLTK